MRHGGSDSLQKSGETSGQEGSLPLVDDSEEGEGKVTDQLAAGSHFSYKRSGHLLRVTWLRRHEALRPSFRLAPVIWADARHLVIMS
jgi:hypothetical protein